jgi:hypothetical protein
MLITSLCYGLWSVIVFVWSGAHLSLWCVGVIWSLCSQLLCTCLSTFLNNSYSKEHNYSASAVLMPALFLVTWHHGITPEYVLWSLQVLVTLWSIGYPLYFVSSAVDSSLECTASKPGVFELFEQLFYHLLYIHRYLKCVHNWEKHTVNLPYVLLDWLQWADVPRTPASHLTSSHRVSLAVRQEHHA